jgi:hypothetical protein
MFYLASAVPVALIAIDAPVPSGSYEIAEIYLRPVAWACRNLSIIDNALEWENEAIRTMIDGRIRLVSFSPLTYAVLESEEGLPLPPD